LAAANIDDAIAYIYQASEGAVNGGVITNAVIVADQLDAVAEAALAASSVAATAGMVGFQDGALIVELPNYEATVGTITSSDQLVIQNILVDGVRYSIHIAAPELNILTSPTAESSTAAGLSYQVYRHVFLPATDEVDLIAVGTQFTAAADTANGQFTFRENVQTTATVAFDSTSALDDSTANFVGTDGATTTTTSDEVVALSTTSDTAAATAVTYTLDALAAGSINETVNKVVGRGSTLTVSATDFAGNVSDATITLQKGHGAVSVNLDGGATAEQKRVILNTITGSAIQ